jgi:hypothetical protein
VKLFAQVARPLIAASHHANGLNQMGFDSSARAIARKNFAHHMLSFMRKGQLLHFYTPPM